MAEASWVNPPIVTPSELNAELLYRLIYNMTAIHHTPWKCERRGNAFVVVGSNGLEICTFYSSYPDKDERLAKALVRLGCEIDDEKEDMS